MAVEGVRVAAGAAWASESGGYSRHGWRFTGTRAGRAVSGSVKDKDERQARVRLQGAGVVVAGLRPRWRSSWRRRRRPGRVDLALLAEELADQLDVGVPIIEVCGVLGNSAANEQLARALRSARENMRQGWTMTESFAAARARDGQPLFPVTFLNALRVGDAGGETSAMLREFAAAELRADAAWAAIRGACAYPLVVLTLALGISLAVLYFVVPHLLELFQAMTPDVEQVLPLPTRLMLAFSGFLVSWFGVGTVVGLAVALLFALRWARTAAGREYLGRRVLRWPVLGGLLRDQHAAQVLLSAAMLARGGLSNEVWLKEAAAGAANPLYREMLEDVREFLLRQSTSLAAAFVPYADLMGEDFDRVLVVYGKTGQLEQLFTRYAEVLERRVARAVTRVTKLVEPLLTVVVAVYVGLFVISIYWPWFRLLGRMATQTRR